MTCIDLHHFFFIAWRKEASPTRNRNIYNYCCMSISILHKLSLLFLLVLPPRSKSDRHRLSRKSAKKPENWEEKTAVQKREHAKNFAFGKGLFLTDIDRHSTSIKKMQKSPKNWENVGAWTSYSYLTHARKKVIFFYIERYGNDLHRPTLSFFHRMAGRKVLHENRNLFAAWLFWWSCRIIKRKQRRNNRNK